MRPVIKLHTSHPKQNKNHVIASTDSTTAVLLANNVTKVLKNAKNYILLNTDALDNQTIKHIILKKVKIIRTLFYCH